MAYGGDAVHSGVWRGMLIRQQGKGAWHAPSTTVYTDEAELQALIAETPALLPGVGDGPAAVAREVALGSGLR